MEKKTILLFGGSGFVGKSIARVAIEHGHDVVSINRNEYEFYDPLLSQVHWIKGDIHEPDDWKYILSEVDVAIHLIGMVKEKPEEGLTFQHVMYDSAALLADLSEEVGLKTLVYLSAHQDTKSTSEKYRQTKLNVEEYLQTKPFQKLIFRPGLMYGQDNMETFAIKDKVFANLDGPDSKGWSNRPLPVEVVAEVIINAIVHERDNKIYTIDAIANRFYEMTGEEV